MFQITDDAEKLANKETGPRDEVTSLAEIYNDLEAKGALNLDELKVEELANETVQKLRVRANGMKKADPEDHLAARLWASTGQLEAYCRRLNPRLNDADNDKWLELGTTEDVRTEINLEFRREFIQILGLVDRYTEEQPTDQKITLSICKLIQAVASEDHKLPDSDAATFVKEMSDKNTPDEKTKAQRLLKAIQTVATDGPVPFHAYADQFTTAADYQKELEKNAKEREQHYRELIASLDVYLPSKKGARPRYEHLERLPTGTWDNHEEKVRVNLAKGLVKEPVDLRVGKTIVRKGFLGIEHEKDTEQAINTHMENVLVEKNDKKYAKQVEVAHITLYSEKMLSEIRGYKPGQAYEFKDIPFKVTEYNMRYDSIVSASEGLQQLDIPPAQKIQDGSYKVPIIQKITTKGKEQVIENWMHIPANKYLKWKEVLQTSVRSFEKLGFSYDEEKEKQDAPVMHLENIRNTAESWIDDERVGIELSNALNQEIARAEKAGNIDLANQLKENTQVIEQIAETISMKRGRFSKYEALAKERLLQQGLSKDSPDWEQQLHLETAVVCHEIEEKAIVLKELATQIHTLYAEIEKTGKRDSDAEKLLTEMLVNLKYQIEINTLERLLTHAETNVAKQEIIKRIQDFLENIKLKALKEGRQMAEEERRKQLARENEEAIPNIIATNEEQKLKELGTNVYENQAFSLLEALEEKVQDEKERAEWFEEREEAKIQGQYDQTKQRIEKNKAAQREYDAYTDKRVKEEFEAVQKRVQNKAVAHQRQEAKETQQLILEEIEGIRKKSGRRRQRTVQGLTNE